MKFSTRAKEAEQSPSLSLAETMRKLRSNGMEITNFGARPDVPSHVIEAAKSFLDSGKSCEYTDPRGLPELRQVISKKLQRENDIEVNPDTEVVVTLGGKQAIFAALMALIEPGDEVLVEDPGWFCFKTIVGLTGGIPKPVKLHENDSFLLNVEEINKQISKKTKILMLCNPHNPTGSVHTRDNLDKIAKLVQKNDLIVIADECWQHLLYDGNKHISFASLDGMRERTVTVNTTSKIYNMAGWRVGWASGTKEIIEKITAIQATSVTCPTSVAQAGAIAALNTTTGMGDLSFDQLKGQYSERRELVLKGIRNINGVTCVTPLGGIFMFPNFGELGLPSTILSSRLLLEAGIGSVPGSEFGLNGEGHLRILFTSPEEEIHRGLERMQKFFDAINR